MPEGGWLRRAHQRPRPQGSSALARPLHPWIPAPSPPRLTPPPPRPPPGPDMGEVLKQKLAVPDQRLEETEARCREGSAGRGLPEVGRAEGQGRGVVGPGGEEGAAGERGMRLRAEGVGSREDRSGMPRPQGIKGLKVGRAGRCVGPPSGWRVFGARAGFKGSLRLDRLMVLVSVL